MDEMAMRALAKRFFDAVEAGDIEAVGAIYAPGAVIWHNTDGLETSREANLETLRGFTRLIGERRYTNRRVQVSAHGFTQQHVLEGARRDGTEVSLAACIVCEVHDGRITRLDEYFDSAALTAFVGR
jgi:ketosteroid isomerase-like protein